jgi:hypothetical protein
MAKKGEGSRGRPVIELEEGEAYTTTVATRLGISSRMVVHLIHQRKLKGRRNHVHGKKLAKWIVDLASVKAYEAERNEHAGEAIASRK